MKVLWGILLSENIFAHIIPTRANIDKQLPQDIFYTAIVWF